jgi:hypothetical protein
LASILAVAVTLPRISEPSQCARCRQKKTFKALLNECKRFAGFAVHWLFVGLSGHEAQQIEGGLTMSVVLQFDLQPFKFCCFVSTPRAFTMCPVQTEEDIQGAAERVQALCRLGCALGVCGPQWPQSTTY